MAVAMFDGGNDHKISTPTAAARSFGYLRGRSKYRQATGESASQHSQDRHELTRAASYTYIGNAVDDRLASPAPLVNVKILASNAIVAVEEEVVEQGSTVSSGWNTPDDKGGLSMAPPRPRDIIERLTTALESGATRPADHSRLVTTDANAASTTSRSSETIAPSTASTAHPTPVRRRPSLGHSISRHFNRRSWYQSRPSTPSRTPSPEKTVTEVQTTNVAASGGPAALAAGEKRPQLVERALSKSGMDNRLRKTKPADKELKEPKQLSSSRRSIMQRATRPVSEILGSTGDPVTMDENSADSQWIPAVPRLPKSFSTDRLPVLRSAANQESPLRAAPLPRILSPESTTSSTFAVLKRKDELWSVFRNLDAEHARFASKSTALKANVVRSALLPFLRSYADHPSNRSLRPEDLDRRTNILNKWWIGLLEMLHGQNNQSISGTDRPVILDAVVGIMDRTEWRLAPSPFSPLFGLSTDDLSAQSRPSSSSSSSGFLAASVHHNVKNIFVQNLSSQMAFVVDKMSLRNASASLVAFCGKATAFAFFFVPGMADVLVRLWEVPADTLRRVLSENGVGKFERIDDLDHETISARFPPALQNLGFKSLTTYVRQLRIAPPLPLGTSGVNWWGAWLDRWTGRESDLFYVFVKHFHILLTDYLPLDSSKRDRVCSPGVLIIHAQILSVFDASLHRNSSAAQQDHPVNSPTFDDLLADPDAVASTIPFAPANVIRIMAENRLIMLVRDFLSERTSDHPIARSIFAQSFNDLLQASARGISVYDHAACYTLLDFLEEALVIIVRYEQAKDASGTIIDSPFWLSVCKKMMGSENTMTEIRLYAFLYTVWTTVVVDPQRRKDLCLGLLLDEQVFQSRFNHWCPMVRAYYMRLVCWRVARFDGESANSDDIEILETLLKRLRTTWSFFLHLYNAAQGEWKNLPITSPSYPAPGRRLLIVRTDAITSPHDNFQSFDAIATASPQRAGRFHTSNWRRTSGAPVLEDPEMRPVSETSSVNSDTDSPEDSSLGGFFRRMIGSRARSQSQESASQASPGSSRKHEALPSMELNLSSPMKGNDAYPTVDQRTPSRDSSSKLPSDRPNRPRPDNYSFKFSLEFVPSARTSPPALRLFPPKLPGPAQALLHARSTDSSAASSASAKLLFAPCRAVAPVGSHIAQARYCGRALAEWTIIVGECQSFFERRKNEGVPSNRRVETPLLGVEVFRRPT